MSNFGWTYLSREALRQAEIQLAGEEDGVRDEIGFLAIHQRYADRFFPGTSVLHTRLRYALFVPWIYQTLHKERSRNGVDSALQRAELDLVKRLRAAEGEGVIGGRIYPKPASQPPSTVYWTALGAWGLLRPRADGRFPTRAQIHALVQHRPRSALDDDGQPLFGTGLPFVSLPPPPENWDSDDPLDFTLTSSEATFFHSVLTNIRTRSANAHSPEMSARKSLFARLAAAKKVHALSCWDPAIVALAGDDAAALRRAGDVASLAAIGRSVYAALVETLCEQSDKRGMEKIHRSHLRKIVEEHASRASRVNIDVLDDDIHSIPPSLVAVLQDTLAWLTSGARDVLVLRSVYERAECARKGQRARLPNTLNGRDRRMEWDNEKHSPGEPLHYRWPNVSRLLSDLWEAV